MSKKPISGKSLSVLAFCLSASAANAAPANEIRIQALELLQENKISAEEFKRMVGAEANGIETSFISAGNYASFISEGNYASFISAGNYADFISAGNYSSFISNGNYASSPEHEAALDIPSPQVSE